MGDVMNKELTIGQQRAIEALMLTNTIVLAAERAKVSERSIYRWLNQEHFQTALMQVRRNALAYTSTRLQQMSASAVGTLQGVLNDAKASPTSRVSAARLSLDMMYRGLFLDDIVQRLYTLESQSQSNQPG